MGSRSKPGPLCNEPCFAGGSLMNAFDFSPLFRSAIGFDRLGRAREAGL